MSDSERRVYVRMQSDMFNTYSNMWDVLAMEGDDDDATVVVVASFTTAEEASEWADGQSDHYVLAVRPPSTLTNVVHKWMTFVSAALTYGDYPVRRFRRY